MINPTQLMRYVIEPVLDKLKMNSPQARWLLLETAMQESRLCHLDQITDEPQVGPALGIYQMEAATHDDIWKNFLAYNPITSREVRSFSLQKNANHGSPDAQEMQGNLYYATAMARVHYWRVPLALPEDLKGRAAYWKTYYNTHLGHGTKQQYINNTKILYRLYDEVA